MREVQEELGLSIKDLRLLGTLESLFVYNGKPGHEIVQVYDARLEDAQVYEQLQIVGHESDGTPFTASWQGSSSFTDQSPLVPVGLQALLEGAVILD